MNSSALSWVTKQGRIWGFKPDCAPHSQGPKSKSLLIAHKPRHWERGIRYREGLGALLDDEALDDVREDLGFHDGLGRFVLTIVGGGAGDGGGSAARARGHPGNAGLRMEALGGLWGQRGTRGVRGGR